VAPAMPRAGAAPSTGRTIPRRPPRAPAPWSARRRARRRPRGTSRRCSCGRSPRRSSGRCSARRRDRAPGAAAGAGTRRLRWPWCRWRCRGRSCLARVWMIRVEAAESGTIPASPHADPPRMAEQHYARILDGKGIAEDLLDSLKVQVDARLAEGKRRPGLAVVLVGGDPASQSYVRNKRRAARKVGIQAFDHDFPDGAGEAELLALIDRLNADPQVHGILVQLPLPGIPDATRLIHRIDPRKDVDGFHPQNVGHLALRQFGLRPCTPRGITTLLAYTDRPVRGLGATIVGVSKHVGRPMALELLIAGCTTTACH